MYCFVESETKMFMTVDISFQNELQRQTLFQDNNEKLKLGFEGNTCISYFQAGPDNTILTNNFSNFGLLHMFMFLKTNG